MIEVKLVTDNRALAQGRVGILPIDLGLASDLADGPLEGDDDAANAFAAIGNLHRDLAVLHGPQAIGTGGRGRCRLNNRGHHAEGGQATDAPCLYHRQCPYCCTIRALKWLDNRAL